MSISVPAKPNGNASLLKHTNHVRVPKAAELVSRALRKQIVRGELKEGSSLMSESDMMARYGVSRPTLREAIRILESEGLITVSRGARGGAIVHRPSIDVATRYIGLLLQANGTSLQDIYRVHMLVEPIAARILAEKHSTTAPNILHKCLIEGQLNFDSDSDYGIATARFRNSLIELADIPPLTLLMGMLNTIFESYWARLTVTAGMQIDNSKAKRRGLNSLEKLIKLIEIGDGDAAEDHWRRHTEFVQNAMIEWLPTATVIDIMDDH
jgi:DNA-binding FadR family transcriptional regulator